MQIRFFTWLAIGVAAAFLVVASQSFALQDIANVAFGVSIGVAALATYMVVQMRKVDLPTGMAVTAGLIAAFMIVASQAFSLSTVETMAFVEGLVLSGMAIIALSLHELSTERVVHSLEVKAERARTRS